MFFRPEVYDQSQVRSFDVNSLAKDAMLGDLYLAQDVLGQTYTVASGFGATSTSTLAITIASGQLYIQAQTDALAVAAGDLAADTTIIEQQAWNPAQSIVLTTSALAAGQSQWVLLQAGFTQTDTIAPNDPDNGLLNFFNSANWSEPLVGPGGNGLTVPTLRTNGVILNAVYGNPATTGSQSPPNTTSGYVGLYLIDLAYGQTVVTQGDILTAGPSVGSNVPTNYPYAPFLAGLLSSHHDGNPGQAPKINLATEVQGALLNGGLSEQALTSSGSFTVPAGVFFVRAYVTGGGGSGSGGTAVTAGGGGGAGGTAIKVCAVTPGQVVTVTVGGGGVAVTGNALGNAGASSSFGSYCSATGGAGAGPIVSSGTSGGLGGAGSGGDINIDGGNGNDGFYYATPAVSIGGVGGTSYWGGGGRQSENGTNTFGQMNGQAFGSGAGGAYLNSATVAGGAGAAGIVVVQW